MNVIKSSFAIIAVLLLAACASTPQSRIKKNPGLFESFPPEAQAKIQKGEVDLGFTPDMVEMAKDEPNRKYQRKTAAGEAEVWSYTGFHTTTERQRVQATVRAQDNSGAWRSVNDWVWVDVQQKREYELLRIEFVGGKVTAIETLTN